MFNFRSGGLSKDISWKLVLSVIYSLPPPQLNSSSLGPLKPPGWHDQFRGVFAAGLEKTVLEIPIIPCTTWGTRSS